MKTEQLLEVKTHFCLKNLTPLEFNQNSERLLAKLIFRKFIHTKNLPFGRFFLRFKTLITSWVVSRRALFFDFGAHGFGGG